MERTIKYASFLNQATDEVRHFLIDEVDGHAFTDLVLFTAGREEKLHSGTDYESRQKADALGNAWVKHKGFKWASDEFPPYESFDSTVRLAMRLGHDAIYDPRLVQTDLRKPRFNATGLVLLKEWSEMHAKNGGTYKYAVTLNGIRAEPQLPRGNPLEISGSDFAQQMRKAVEAKKSVGPSVEFLFAGMTLVS